MSNRSRDTIGAPQAGDYVEVISDNIIDNGPWTKKVTSVEHYRNPFTDQYHFDDESYDIDWRMFTSKYMKGDVTYFVIGERTTSSKIMEAVREKEEA